MTEPKSCMHEYINSDGGKGCDIHKYHYEKCENYKCKTDKPSCETCGNGLCEVRTDVKKSIGACAGWIKQPKPYEGCEGDDCTEKEKEFCGCKPLEDKSDYCVWSQEDCWDMSDLFNTSCGKSYCLSEGTPKDNEMNYCSFCGKKLEEELAKEGTDE